MAEEGSDPPPDQRVSILLSVVCHPEPATLRRGRVEGSRARFFAGVIQKELANRPNHAAEKMAARDPSTSLRMTERTRGIMDRKTLIINSLDQGEGPALADRVSEGSNADSCHKD